MNPYKVLGVGENASQEDIRKAYLELVKKYHPDRYQGSPYQAEANERLKEVNAAYDQLSRKQSSTNSQNHSYSGAYSQEFLRVEQMIQRNDLNMARQELVSIGLRNAKWHYLYGVISYKQNMHDEASKHFETAYKLEPNNFEYKNAYDTVSNPRAYAYNYGNYGGRRSGGTNGEKRSGCSTCDCCTALLCADCCCEAMGGDLIPCC